MFATVFSRVVSIEVWGLLQSSKVSRIEVERDATNFVQKCLLLFFGDEFCDIKQARRDRLDPDIFEGVWQAG